jgi:hypothetical protein
MEKTLGIIRHILTFAGGLIVTKGYISESLVEELIGGIVTIIGTIWSIKSKK